MTLTRLDNELLNKPAPSQPQPVIIDAVPVEIATLNDNLGKEDLKFRPVPNSELSGKQLLLLIDMRQKSTADLENLMLSELRKGDGTFGSLLAGDFFRNAIQPSESFTITHGAGSDFSNLVAGTEVFKGHSAVFRKKLDKEIKDLGKSGPFEASRLKDRVPPPTPSWSPQGLAEISGVLLSIGISFLPFTRPDFQAERAKMLALIGSFQGSRVFLHDFVMNPVSDEYSGTLFYQLIDHFGVDNSDIIFDGHGHGTEGQVAFWVLQHERHVPPGHIPYRLKVVIREGITGSFR